MTTAVPEDLQKIEAELKRRLPWVRCEWDLPENPNGDYSLDVRIGGKHVVVEIAPERIYGVSLLIDDTLPSGKRDKVFQPQEREDMLTHVVGLFLNN